MMTEDEYVIHLLSHPEEELDSAYQSSLAAEDLIAAFRRYYATLANDILVLGSQLTTIRSQLGISEHGN